MYDWIAGFLRVSRDINEIPWGIASIVTAEDCCIYIAAYVEALIQEGWQMSNPEDSIDTISAIVRAKVSNMKEANTFAKMYTGDIMAILEDTTKKKKKET